MAAFVKQDLLKPHVKKYCRFCRDKSMIIDYKDTTLLNKFISQYGLIESRRRSGCCAKHQRRVTQAIKRARFLALMPYINR